MADHDPILATINGSCTNHSAEAASITRPHVGAQEAVFDKILTSSRTHPDEVSYVEMHGTGTQAGDASEMQSVLATFAPEHRGKRHQPLYLGSAKSNVGHAESASGVASLIKVLLMLKHNTIPPHCGIKKQINHGFPKDMSERNVHIARRLTAWTHTDSNRKAFLNNFSAAGGNTALILEDYRGTPSTQEPRKHMHIVTLSAKSNLSLTRNIDALSDFLEQHPELSIEDLSYTTTARRLHHSLRAVFTGTNLAEIVEALRASKNCETFARAPAHPIDVCFVFTGQGANYLGMGKELLSCSVFADEIRRLDHLAQLEGFPSVLPIIQSTISETTYAELSPTATQLALTCIQIALTTLWSSWGFTPTSVIGHSLGDYAALYTCGALSAWEAIYLVGKRARLLEEKCSRGTHGMIAIKLSLSATQELLGESDYEIACINSPQETVISCSQANVDTLTSKLSSTNVKFTQLNLPYAFHSAQVKDILDDFKKIAKSISFKNPSIPFHSALYGCTVRTAGDLGDCAEYLSRHCRETVNFLGAVASAEATGSKNQAWFEVGPHPICSNMIKAKNPQLLTMSTLRRGEDAWKTTTKSLADAYCAGVAIDWKGYHDDAREHVKVLPLPSYQWDLKRYWMDYTNDWCLTKGDPPPATVPETSRPFAPAKEEARRLTTTVQYVIEEVFEETTACVVAESDVSDPALRKILLSHRVNGVPLCTSSCYADMALTVADYLYQKAPSAVSDKRLSMDVADMSATQPLIARGSEERQLIRIRAQADWTASKANVKIYSVNGNGKTTSEHANCTVNFGNGDVWAREWARMSYFVRSRISSLHNDAALASKDKVHHIKRGMFYRLFSTLVEYGHGFQGCNEAVLDSDALETTGRVTMKSTKEDGDFFCSPYWIESLGQVTGFTMNANDTLDSKDAVYINHGWESMKIAKTFDPAETHETYVKMQPNSKTNYSGDLYVFQGETIVAVYQGVTFQQVPRRVLSSLLPKAATPSTGANKAPAPTAKPTPAHRPMPAKRTGPAPMATHKLKSSAVVSEQPSAQKSPGIVKKALDIIASEVGVSVSEMKDDEMLADLGIDSLLSLTITGTLREGLNLDIDSSSFTACETVRSLRELIESKAPSTVSSSGEGSDPSSRSSSDDTSETSDGESTSGDSTPSTTTSVEDVAPELPKKMAGLVAILAEEIGVEPNSVNGELAELGLDSLMSLSILGRAREELGLELAADFFAEHDTVESLETYFGHGSSSAVEIPEGKVSTASLPYLQVR